jgi:hypothetical protein
LINNPTDVLFHMSMYMQRWRVLVKPTDMTLLDVARDKIRRLYVRTRDGG